MMLWNIIYIFNHNMSYYQEGHLTIWGKETDKLDELQILMCVCFPRHYRVRYIFGTTDPSKTLTRKTIFICHALMCEICLVPLRRDLVIFYSIQFEGCSVWSQTLRLILSRNYRLSTFLGLKIAIMKTKIFQHVLLYLRIISIRYHRILV